MNGGIIKHVTARACSDYGHSTPSSLRHLLSNTSSEVRVHSGEIRQHDTTQHLPSAPGGRLSQMRPFQIYAYTHADRAGSAPHNSKGLERLVLEARIGKMSLKGSARIYISNAAS